MADWQNPNPINTNPGGDTKYQGFVKANENFFDIYNKLNILKKLQGAPTPPANPATGEVWFDTSTGTIKRYNGAEWVVVAALPDLSNVDDSVLLNKIKNVDGSGSGLDADKLDGFHASQNPAPAVIPVADDNGKLNGWIDSVESADNATKWDGASKFVSTSAPSDTEGNDGDIWFQIEE